jgi:hypothetical protein
MVNNCPFDITPYSQSETIVTPNIFNLNYTNQDFWSMKTRLQEYIQQNFSTEFTDFVEADLGIMIIENVAFLADTLSFKMDQIANEIFIDTVTQIENAFRLAKLVGFQPTPPIASKSLWTATINNPLLTDITIPTPFGVTAQSGGDSISIELFPADSNNEPLLDQDIIIPAGNIVNASIVGLQGLTRTDNASGNGQVGQSITLQYFPVIYDSIRVDVDGVRWEQVDYFTDSQPRREYRVEFDSTYTAFIIFGNGQAGLIPSTGSQIQVTYRQGGGSTGNIVSGAVTTQTIVNVPGLEFPISVSFSNYTSGQNGYDGDTIDDIRLKLPAWARAQNRAVTGLDYKTLAYQFTTPYFGEIGKATAVLRNYGCAANIIDIYVLALDTTNSPGGLTTANDDLKVALSDYLTNYQMFTDYVCIKDGEIVSVDITLDVILSRLYRKFEDQLRTIINRKLTQFFALPNWDFGESLKATDVVKALSGINEVDNFEATLTTNDPNNSGNIVTTRFSQIIRPDIVNITFIYE